MNLATTYESELWNEKSTDGIVSECVDVLFNELEFSQKDVEICFLFTTDAEIRILNKTFRGIDRPTNVLSFPNFDADMIPLEKKATCSCGDTSSEMPCILGSIAVAYETTLREAEEQGKSFGNHLRHLIVHSLLHLFGYDHVESNDAEVMESLEINVLQKMNISDPYQQRSY